MKQFILLNTNFCCGHNGIREYFESGEFRFGYTQHNGKMLFNKEGGGIFIYLMAGGFKM